MSHEITNIDSLLVPKGQAYRTWHNLENTSPNEVITLEEVQELDIHPTVVTGKVTAEINGEQVPLEGYKSLVAQTGSGKLHPLHIAKNGYSIIQNQTVWDTMTKALEGIDIASKVTCVGTLSGMRKYFISVAVGDDDGGFEVNGDKFFGNLNFVTSHDGTMAFRAFDSCLRVVCANTLNWSVEGDKNMDFKMYHKGDVKPVAASLGKYINSVLRGREMFKEAMEKFHTIQVADSDIEKVVGGFFIQQAYKTGNKLSEGFTTRTRNTIEEISRLSRVGLGNSGDNLYDVFNGATEYYTTGEGVGKTTSAGKRAYSSEFGTASERKVEFADYLLSGRYESKMEEAGKVLSLSN